MGVNSYEFITILTTINFVMVAKRTGSTVVSDGATNNKGQPILNLLEYCDGLVGHVQAIDCPGHVKDKNHIGVQRHSPVAHL